MFILLGKSLPINIVWTLAILTMLALVMVGAWFVIACAAQSLIWLVSGLDWLLAAL